MHDFVGLVHALAWPVVVLVCVMLLKPDLSSLLAETGHLLRRAKGVKAKAFGVALDLAAEVAQKSVPPEPLTGDATASKQEFARLATEYRDLAIADYTERVAARRDLANRLGSLVVALDLDRRQLCGGHEGERVAFASASLIKPARGDVPRLLKAATVDAASGPRLFRFTGYRIVLALTQHLADASRAQLKTCAKVLDCVEDNAEAQGDPSLQGLIDRTRPVIDQALAAATK